VVAFRATLEEIAEADVLLHVIDASHPNSIEHAEVVRQTLAELDAGHLPTLVVLNKIDRLNVDELADVVADFPGAVPISALKHQGLNKLLMRVRRIIRDLMLPVEVCIPYAEGKLISVFYTHGEVEHAEHLNQGVRLTGRMPHHLATRFEPYMAADDSWAAVDMPTLANDLDEELDEPDDLAEATF